jgi:NAD+ synthase (glutamine-hydrolysing)
VVLTVRWCITLACEALGSENVRAILMPSPYSSEHSIKDAEQLSKNLNNPYDIIRIDTIYEDFLKDIKAGF